MTTVILPAPSTAGVEEEQQLDETVVHRWAQRLHNVDFTVHDGGLDGNVELTIGKAIDAALQRRNLELIGDLPTQRFRAGADDDLQWWVCALHGANLPGSTAMRIWCITDPRSMMPFCKCLPGGLR
jgi:hypothetical protein